LFLRKSLILAENWLESSESVIITLTSGLRRLQHLLRASRLQGVRQVDRRRVSGGSEDQDFQTVIFDNENSVTKKEKEN
jgi:hypothetical protein